MAREPLAPLATKKFTTEDFERALAANLEKKRLKDNPKPAEDEWETVPDTEDEWETVPAEVSAKSDPFPKGEEKGAFWDSSVGKAIDWYNTPTTKFGEERAKVVDKLPPPPEFFKNTGGQNKLQDFLAEVEAAGHGFRRGAWEGIGRAADMITTPSTIGGLVGGKLANMGIRGAGLIDKLTRVGEATQIPHGLKTALNPDESVMNRIFGGVEAAGGVVGSLFGTNTSRGTAKPETTPVPKVEAKPTGLVDKAVAKNQPPKPPPPAAPPAAEGVLSKATDNDLESLLYHEDPAVQEAAAKELVRREEQATPEVPIIKEVTREPVKITEKYDEFGNRVDDKYLEMNQDPRTRAAKETSEEMTARLFPGMKRDPEKAGMFQGIKNFVSDEKGEIDIDALYNKYQRRKANQAKALEPEVLPAEETALARTEPEIIEPEMKMAQALPSGRDVARLEGDLFQGTNRAPRSKFRNFLADESGEFNPDFMNEPGTQEFSPDLVQQSDEAFGGTSPRFSERMPTESAPRPSSFSERLLQTLSDETGAVPRKPVREVNLQGKKFPVYKAEDFAALRDEYDIRPAYLSDTMPPQGKPKNLVYLDMAGENRPHVMTPKKPSFGSRLKETLTDESGNVPRRPKSSNVWANLPDNVRSTFEQAGIGPKDIEGYSLKDINDTFNNFVRENAGLEPELRTAPDKPQPTLIKPGGERIAPIDPEEAQIAQLTKDAMRAANRERDTLLRGGAEELSPEELESFRQQMQQGERFAEQVDTTVPQSVRDRTPLLRSKDYMEIPPESAKSSRRRASGLWGGVNDTFQQPQPKLENPLTPPKAEGGQSAMERFIQSLYKDESGELNLEGLFGEAEPNQRPMPLLPDEASLEPGIPVRDRAAGKPPEEQSLFGKIKDAPKGLMSMDLPFMTSAAFRQAKPLAWTADWFKAWGTAARAYGSEEAYKAMEDSWKQSKYFKPRYKPSYDVEGNITGYKEVPSPAEEIGVHLAGGKFGPAEEQIRAQLAEQIPGWGSLIKRSNRAYQAFINDLRVNKTTELLDQLEWTGTDNDKTVAKALGEFVNDATGRGSLKWAGPGGRMANLERIAPVLQNTMWSPRLFAANTKFLNPFTYTSLPDPARRQYIGGALRMAGTWISFAGLAKMAGAAVSLDPTNSDFGKIKIGNTRVDPAGGMQQLMVFLAREAPKAAGEAFGFPTGRFTSSSSGKSREYGTGAFPIDRASVAEDFATSKLDPMSRLAYDIMRSSSKRPVHLGDRFVQMTLPIMAQDIADAMKEDPSLERLLGTALGSSTGMGVNTYGKGERFGDPVFTDSIEQYLGQPSGSLRGTISKW